MAASFFGHYLIENGVITSEMLEHALQVQRSANLMLGELAVSSGLLSVRDANEINLRQQIKNQRFGEIALALGLLNASQLEQLLTNQKKHRKYLGDVLIELGLLEQEQLDQHLNAHEQLGDKAYQAFLKAIKGHPVAEYLTATMVSCNQLFIRNLHEKSKFSQLLNPAVEQPEMDVVTQITINEMPPLKISLATNEQTAALIASKFAFIDIEYCDLEFATDAVGEFLNIIIGHLPDHAANLAEVERSSTNLNQKFVDILSQPKPLLAVKMTSQIGDFYIAVSLDE